MIYHQQPSDVHEFFDFDKNALNFRNFVEDIRAYGGGDGPEDWAGAFNLAKNLSWSNDSFKFIVHIADAPSHETFETDEIITYFAKNDFSIAGFMVDGDYSQPFYQRAQKLFRDNGNFKYVIKYFSTYDVDQDYFLDLVYESFQSLV